MTVLYRYRVKGFKICVWHDGRGSTPHYANFMETLRLLAQFLSLFMFLNA